MACAAALLSGLGTQAVAQTATPVYQFWSLRVNNQDSSAVRSSNVSATTPTLKRLVVSNNQSINDNGTTRNPVPTYSSKYGMAFAPAADGSGWNSSLNGPGGTVNRRFYVQFNVTPTTGSTVRVDSLIANTMFLLTSSNTFLAVAYSKSGFVSDSTTITGGKSPSGNTVGGGFPATATLPADGPAPIALSQVNTTTGNIATYRLALNNAAGVTVTAPQTLSIRLYYSCSANAANASRYALLKDVLVKSTQRLVTGTKVPKATAGLAVYPNPVQDKLTVNHEATRTAARINVYAATGQKVASFVTRPNTTETPISTAELAKGIYLVEYASDNARVTSRLVKE
ncbi:hypothetical protein B0919_07810 [Hymenobacter sp. CRA2]|nr:hypothetical protein B0919_07810 [Hymenobacter sp. CRA2]